MIERASGEDVGRTIEVRRRVAEQVVGRTRELDLLLAALAAGRDLVLEGPPGTSKTTLLRAITGEWSVPMLFVEGNADLTPAKLLGHHNPARVLAEDYQVDNFVDGPLVRAMRSGGFLYFEEFNRAPDDTLNTLLTALADREVELPRVGRVRAEPTFRVVATMNPYDNVGTTRLSTSIHDRMCWLAVGYQDETAELEIVARRAPHVHQEVPARVAADVRRDAVAVTRATRRHPDVRQGSSVRGAIDLALVAGELLAMRGIVASGLEEDPEARVHVTGPVRGAGSEDPRSHYAETLWDAMVVTLSGRIHLDEAVEVAPEGVLRQIWEDRFLLAPAAAAPG